MSVNLSLSSEIISSASVPAYENPVFQYIFSSAGPHCSFNRNPYDEKDAFKLRVACNLFDSQFCIEEKIDHSEGSAEVSSPVAPAAGSSTRKKILIATAILVGIVAIGVLAYVFTPSIMGAVAKMPSLQAVATLCRAVKPTLSMARFPRCGVW